MLENFKKLIVLEVSLIIFFFVTSFLSSIFKLSQIYCVSTLGILVLLFIFYKTVVLTLKIIAKEMGFEDFEIENEDQTG